MVLLGRVVCSMIILVDDLRNFNGNYSDRGNILTFRNCYDAIEFLKVNDEPISELWLDHDLGFYKGKEHDIFTLVDYIEENYYVTGNDFMIDKVYVHTSNPSGGDRVFSTMKKIFNTTRVNPYMYF